MAVDKMLVAFDESEGSKKALKTASELAAANPNAHIDLVYVVPFPMVRICWPQLLMIWVMMSHLARILSC